MAKVNRTKLVMAQDLEHGHNENEEEDEGGADDRSTTNGTPPTTRPGAYREGMASSSNEDITIMDNLTRVTPRNEDDAPAYLAEATLVEEAKEEEEEVMIGVGVPDQNVKGFSGYFILALMMIMMMIVVVGVTVGLVVSFQDKGGTNDNNLQVVTSAPTESERRQAFRTILLSHPRTTTTTTTSSSSNTATTNDATNLISETTLNDPQSTHYDALTWLVEEDEFVLRNPPQDDVVLSTVILERFVVVVFYFSTRGDAWIRLANFLQPQASVCEWHVPSDTITETEEQCDCIPAPFIGVGCDPDGFVNAFYLRT
jgi:hypothetical protein